MAWVKVYALVDACGGRVSGFHKLAFIFGRSVSHDGNSVPVKGVAGREMVQGEKRILILSVDGAFVFLHTCAELPTGFCPRRSWDIQSMVSCTPRSAASALGVCPSHVPTCSEVIVLVCVPS